MYSRSPSVPAHPAADARIAALLELGFRPTAPTVTAECVRLADRRWRITQSAPTMGTLASISLLGASRDALEELLGAAWTEMQRVVDLLNRYQDSSALGVLNAEGCLDSAPDELLAVLRAVDGVATRSDGAFDPTVQPLVDLLLAARERGDAIPDPEALREARSRVGWGRVELRGRSVRLRDSAGLTLDGIAKGYVVDRVANILAAGGAREFLIDAGGDIRLAGTRDGTAPWRVAVRDPDDTDEALQVLTPREGAIATSGDYEIHLGADREWHHIVDARRTASARAARAVTVCAPTAMAADALATAAFVLGPERGLRLLQETGDSEGLIVTAGGSSCTTGWSGASPEEPR